MANPWTPILLAAHVSLVTHHGSRITHYIDLKPRTLACRTPVIHHNEIPAPDSSFILPMVGNRGARIKIRDFLQLQGFTEGVNCLHVT